MNNPDSPADKYIGELKLWGIRVVAVLVLIALAVLGLNLMGDGLRDLLDPRLARKR